MLLVDMSSNNTRSKNAIKNANILIINKTWMLILAFSVRTIFIRILGEDYTGVSSLYTNVLSVLSLAELGIGNISSYYLYEAISKDDKKKIYKITQKFKHIYRYIILAIVVLGLALVPFLKIIVNSELDSKRLIIYYLLFLANTVASYAFTYRKQVLAADQKQYILNTCNNVVVSLMYVFQIIFLIISKNYLIFLIVQVVFTFAEGLICNIFVCRNYPYLKQRYEKNIDKIEFPELKKTVIMTFVGRVSDVLITQTDSILISTIINTVTVGFYSNYYLLITYIVNYFGVATSGIIASFGNLQTEDNKEKSYRYFIMLVTGFGLTATLCSVCFICVIQDFIVIWIGKKYLLNMWFVLALVINFFVLIMTNPLYIYKDTLGIFKKGQYARLIGAIINIVLSIVLGIKIGLVGIIIATPISRLLTYFWYDGFVLMHFYGKKMREYIALMGKVFVSAILVVLSGYKVCKFISYTGVAGIIIKLCVCVAVFAVIDIILFRDSELIKWVLEKSGFNKKLS